MPGWRQNTSMLLPCSLHECIIIVITIIIITTTLMIITTATTIMMPGGGRTPQRCFLAACMST